ncbi:hypothetical protein QE152_g19206 [Popillia japonica]|uniref:Uncharacterized protein n=1 Tax=Popillia japonica TaxID=7064 RepID=A0AAW1KRY8_POPJA
MNRADLDVRNEDVDDLIASHSEPLTNDELIEIQDANTTNTEDNKRMFPMKSDVHKYEEELTDLERT